MSQNQKDGNKITKAASGHACSKKKPSCLPECFAVSATSEMDDVSTIGSVGGVTDESPADVLRKPIRRILSAAKGKVSQGLKKTREVAPLLKQAWKASDYPKAAELWKVAKANMHEWLVIGMEEMDCEIKDERVGLNNFFAYSLQKIIESFFLKQDHMLLGRSLLEIALKLSVVEKNVEEFGRIRCLLAPYYEDCIHLPHSENRMEISGLILMYLLTENRLAEFHMELEKLPHVHLKSEKHIATAFKLEQYMMLGNYNKVGGCMKKIMFSQICTLRSSKFEMKFPVPYSAFSWTVWWIPSDERRASASLPPTSPWTIRNARGCCT